MSRPGSFTHVGGDARTFQDAKQPWEGSQGGQIVVLPRYALALTCGWVNLTLTV